MSERRVALVTGGGRGIGRGIVEALAAIGYDLAVNYRSDAGSARLACEAAERLGAGRVIALKGDVAELDEARGLVDRAVAEFGRLDLLVSNAGVAPERRLDLLETTPESWDRVLAVNLRGPFFLAQRAAQAMKGRGDRPVETPPMIVFVTSVSSVFASEDRPEYCVSKAGASMVAQLFAARLAGDGVLVYEVRPGVIATDMTAAVAEAYDRRIAEGLSPIRRWGTPEDVGRAVAGLAGGAFGFTTGQVIYVDGGLHLRRL